MRRSGPALAKRRWCGRGSISFETCFPKRRPSAFRQLLSVVSLEALLDWRGETKIVTMRSIIELLSSDGVESESDLASWLSDATHRNRLLAIRGVGPKTVDYLGILVGAEASAIDRHLKRFLLDAGVVSRSRKLSQQVLSGVAAHLGISLRDLDYAIWSAGSNR